ncbi:MAG: hypothetical protein JSR76_01800 [Verrucomicrobia bacterium]|nr:hypothetical protein [Verrucomicrobiota bacterium]
MYPCISIDRYLAHEAMQTTPSAIGLFFPLVPTEKDFEELEIIKELTTPIPLIALFSFPSPEILSLLTSLACFGVEGIRLDSYAYSHVRAIRTHIDTNRLGMTLIVSPSSSHESEKRALHINGAHIVLAQ